MKTNRDALREVLPLGQDGPDICEWDPLRQRPSRLRDPFHGYATTDMVAQVDGLPCRVCDRCAELTHPRLLVSPSVPPHLRPAPAGKVRLCSTEAA